MKNISIPKKVMNLYISCTDFKLINSLFESGKLTSNADLDKHKYSGYSIRFDSRSELLFTDGSLEKNVNFLVIIRAHLCKLTMKKGILILREELTQGVDNATSAAVTKYCISFT